MPDNKIRTLLVDDEVLAIEGLRIRLEKFEEIKIVGECFNGEDALRLYYELLPDLVFLDLKMPGLSGLGVVQAMQADHMPMIIFVTAYSESAIEAFELGAIDYLLKPISLGRLKQSIERVIKKKSNSDLRYNKKRLINALGESSGICISELEEWLQTDEPLPANYPQIITIKKSDNTKILVPVAKINWIDAAGDYMCIHTDEETHVLRITMKKLEQLLDPISFLRIHKSTIVNFNKVEQVIPQKNAECILQLSESTRLKVSRNYYAQIKKVLDSRTI